ISVDKCHLPMRPWADHSRKGPVTENIPRYAGGIGWRYRLINQDSPFWFNRVKPGVGGSMGAQVSLRAGRACFLVAAGLIAASLGGCAGVFAPGGFTTEVSEAMGSNTPVDAAMAALQKGDYARAEELASAASRGNSKDAYAHYVLGEVYFDTGRPEMARKQ